MIIDPSSLGPRQSALRRPADAVVRVLCRTWHNLRCHWLGMTAVLLIWEFAFIRAFIDPTPYMPILFNWTPSVPYKVALVQYSETRSFARGDFIVYRFKGTAQRQYPGLRDQPFFKKIRGVPGDRITVVERQVFINGAPVGLAKLVTFDHRPLHLVDAMVIPANTYYVQGTHPDSFDSRYRESGLVQADQMIAKVTPLF